MVDNGGRGLGEGRRTASRSKRAYSHPESFPQGRLAPGDCQEWRYGGLSAQACFPWAQLKLLLRRHKYHFGYLDIIRVYFRDPAQEGINDDYRCNSRL